MHRVCGRVDREAKRGEGLIGRKERAYERAPRASAHSFTREDPMNRLDEEWIASGVEMNTSIDDPFTFGVESITFNVEKYTCRDVFIYVSDVKITSGDVINYVR